MCLTMPADDLTGGHFAETWSYLAALHADGGTGAADAAAQALAANEEAQQLLEWQQEQEQQRYLEAAGIAPQAANAAMLGTNMLAAWSRSAAPWAIPASGAPPVVQPVIQPAVPLAFRHRAANRGRVVLPPSFDGGAAWAAGPVAAAGAAGVGAAGAAWVGGTEDAIMTAVNTALKDIPAIESEADGDALKRKVVKVFRRANKGLDWSQGTHADRVNEYADYVFGALSWTLGECEWLPEVDFTIVLETAVHEFFPAELLAEVSPIDLEETILKAHDRAFEEKRIEPLLREAVTQLLEGKKAQNRTYNMAEAGRKEAIEPSMRAVACAAEYQGSEEELEGFSWDKIREFMSGWIHGTVKQLYIQAGQYARETLSVQDCHALFSKLVQDGAIPRSIMLDLGIPVPDPWSFISAAVNDAYNTNDVLFPPTSKNAWEGLKDPQPKEELCFFFEMGKCTFGDECFAAHGEHELRGRGVLSTAPKRQRVKTKLCSFFLRGKCTFGDNCMNAHGEDDLREAPTPAPVPAPAGGEEAEERAADAPERALPRPPAPPRPAKRKGSGGSSFGKGGKVFGGSSQQCKGYGKGERWEYDEWGVPVASNSKGFRYQAVGPRWKGGKPAADWMFDEDAEPPGLDHYGAHPQGKGRANPRAPRSSGPDPLRDAFEEMVATAQGEPPVKRSRSTYGK